MCLHAQHWNSSGVRILDWKVCWRWERGEKNREKRQECAVNLEAPSSAASQSCRGPGVLSSLQGKLWRGQPAELSPKGSPQSVSAPAIPCSSPQDTFGCPFCSWFHQTLEQGSSGTLSSAASASLASLPRSWSGKSQEMLTVVESDRSQLWGHPLLCPRVPANTHTHTQVPLIKCLPWPS